MMRGIALLGLDALSSAAYGPEALLTVLLPLGLVGLRAMLPLTLAIVVLLTVVFLSYRQTIDAYPGGGGSYTVAKENLGRCICSSESRATSATHARDEQLVNAPHGARLRRAPLCHAGRIFASARSRVPAPRGCGCPTARSHRAIRNLRHEA